MTSLKMPMIVLAMSAAVAGPVLAQGVSVDTQSRGSAQSTINAPSVSGGANTGVKAQVGAPGAKAGASAQTGTTGALGTKRRCRSRCGWRIRQGDRQTLGAAHFFDPVGSQPDK